MEKKFAIGITIGAALASSFNRVVKGSKGEVNAVGAALNDLANKQKLLQKFEMDTAQLERARQRTRELGAEYHKLRAQLRARDANMSGLQRAITNTTALIKTASGAQKKGYQQSLQLLQKQLQLQRNLPDRIRDQAGALQSAVALQTRMTAQAEASKKAIVASGMSVTHLKKQYDQLHRSIVKVEQSEARRAKLAGVVRGVAAGAVGAAAAAAVLAQPVKAAMGYAYRLAHLANTAYAGESLAARQDGMAQLKAGIHQAVREGGGNRDSAADTLDTLVASGAFGDGRVGITKSLALLPTLQKFGTAAGADPMQLAQIAIAASRFNIAAKDLPQALDMAMRAGQLGGFELRDMAKWLPQQMAAGRQSGLSGMDGFARLLAVNQASRTTAGTVDEAGNNVVNWLAKINSRDTQKDVKKTLGIDLPQYLAAERGQGVDAMAAFVKLIDKLASGDQQYLTLRERAAGEKPDDKRNTFEQMANILQGSAVGKLIQDRQALMGLLGYMNNREYMTDIENKIDPQTGKAVGTGQDSFDLLKTTGQYNTDQLANEKAIAQDAAFSKLTPAINGVASTMVDLARQYPLMTTAAVAATSGLTALAAAAGGSALMQFLMMRSAGAAGVATAAAAKSGIVRSVLGKLPGAASVTGQLLRRAPVLGLGIGALQAGSVWRDNALSGADKKIVVSGMAGGAVGGIAGGAVAGALVGSIIPGVGTLVGGIVGGILGSIGGDKLGRSIAGRVIDHSTKAKAPAAILPTNLAAQVATIAAVPATGEKKLTLQGSYQLNVNGLGMKEIVDLLDQRLARLQQEQEARLRASMLDGATR